MVTFYELYFLILDPWGCLGFSFWQSRFISRTRMKEEVLCYVIWEVQKLLWVPTKSAVVKWESRWISFSWEAMVEVPLCPRSNWLAFCSCAFTTKLPDLVWILCVQWWDTELRNEKNIFGAGGHQLSDRSSSRAAERSWVLRERRKTQNVSMPCIIISLEQLGSVSDLHFVVSWKNASSSIIIFKWLELWYDSVWKCVVHAEREMD